MTTQDERIATLEADARIKAANLELAQARVAELEAALRDITDPIEAMRRNLQEGYTLNGAMCVHMANDPETYRRMAREALKETP